MTKPLKTHPIIRWPGGLASRVNKGTRGWWFYAPDEEGRLTRALGTSDMQGVKDTAEAQGGILERIPNPRYTEELEAYRTAEARREVKRLLGFDI